MSPPALVQRRCPPGARLRDYLQQPPAMSLRLSNLDKTFYPEKGLTKGDLLGYYRFVAPYILPYLHQRPLVMERYVDGIHGRSFFQHHAPGAKSGWLKTVRVRTSRRARDYFLIQDVESLLYVINLGTIPLSGWHGRVDDLDHPDYCVIDLDRGAASWSSVIRVASTLRELCRSMELPHYLKTSGGDGLHVLIPLRGVDYAASRALSELLAHTLARLLPDDATVLLNVASRGERVYVDHMLNARGRTLVVPYSARPRAEATLSMPLPWEALGEELDPRAFCITDAPTLLAGRQRDPWADFHARRCGADELRAGLLRLQAKLASEG